MNKKTILYSEFEAPPAGITKEDVWLNFFVEMADLMGEENRWIATGFRATNDGVIQGGVIFDNFEELCSCFKSDKRIEFFEEDGHLKMRSENEHGYSFFEIKKLSPVGETVASSSTLAPRELHKLLFTTNAYSMKPYLNYKKLLLPAST